MTIVLLPSVSKRENSNSCESSYFPVSKQTVKVQFSPDVFGKTFILRVIGAERDGKFSRKLSGF